MTVLARVGLFQNLEASVLQSLERGGSLTEPRHNAEIFGKGDAADAVYAIVGGEGHVRIGSIDRKGKRLMAEVFGVGDIFGEVAVLDAGNRTASAVAEGRVRLFRIAAPAFLAALDTVPALGLAVARAVARRLRRTYALFEDAAFETLEVRLARQLLYMAAQSGRVSERGIVVESRLRQTDLADLLGATTRSIITILNEWRDSGTVLYDGERAKITIVKLEAMKSLVETAA